MDITGLILAGGRASRMGHQDKGLLTLHGRPMAAHVLDRLRPQVQAVLINANRNAAAYAALGTPVWPDAIPDFAGPLAGLHTGLLQAQTPLLLSVPCDSPFFPLDLAQRLSTALQANQADVAVAETGVRPKHQLQPVFCLARTHLHAPLLAFLQGGGRKVEHWLSGLACVRVLFEDEAAFRNVNTPDELRQAHQP